MMDFFISEMSFYAGEKFTCLDGSATISMEWVKDDYCDCRDGSDEPGMWSLKKCS